MNFLNRVGIAVVLVFACGLVGFAGEESTSSEEPVLVSMIQLIATPEQYQGRSVRVIGYLRFELEGNALFFHKEDFENMIPVNAVRLDLDGKSLEKYCHLTDSYVFVDGRFSSKASGSPAYYSGRIGEIRSIEHLPSRAERAARWKTGPASCS